METHSPNSGAAPFIAANGPAEDPQSMVVVDLGKVSAKKIKKLKKGRGALLDEVNSALQLAAANGPQGKELVPIVFLYRPRKKKKIFGSLL